MFEVIVYHKLTKKIVAYLPFIFVDSVRIGLADCLMYSGYDFAIFNDTEPVVYRDDDGDICLKENRFIINSNLLK